MQTHKGRSKISTKIKTLCVWVWVHVYKPATSKAGNSEVYLICKGYNKEKIVHLLPSLKPMTGSYRTLFSQDSIPDSFFSQVRECSQFFNNLQKLHILENLELYDNFEITKKCLLTTYKDECTRLYIEKCFEGIPEYDRENGKRKREQDSYRLLPRKKIVRGSYNERRRNDLDEPKLQLEFLKKEFDPKLYTNTLKKIEPLLATDMESEDLKPSNEWITFGKPFTKIQSSKFCNDDVLSIKVKVPSNELIKHQSLDLKQAYIQDRIIQNSSYYLLSEVICYKQKSEKFSQKIKTKEGLEADNKYYIVDLLDLQETCDDSKTFLFSILTQILKELVEGDYLELHVPSLLTRVFVGAMYLVSLNFEKITTQIFYIDNFQYQLWSFHQFKGVLQPVLDHFQHLTTLEPPTGLTLLEIVPTLTITGVVLGSKFYKLVTNMNTLQVSKELMIILDCPKKKYKKNYRCSKKPFPDQEQPEFFENEKKGHNDSECI